MNIIDVIRSGFRAFIRKLAGLLNKQTRGKLTPNMVTTIGAVMHLPIALLIADGHVEWAALLLLIFGLFDVLDGELARLQHTASFQGWFYDSTVDRVKATLLFAGIAYNLSSGSNGYWAAIVLLACGLSMSVSYAKARGESALALKRSITDHHKLNHHFSEGLVAYDLLMTVIFLGLILNQLKLATGLIALFSLITVLIIIPKVSREL